MKQGEEQWEVRPQWLFQRACDCVLKMAHNGPCGPWMPLELPTYQCHQRINRGKNHQVTDELINPEGSRMSFARDKEIWNTLRRKRNVVQQSDQWRWEGQGCGYSGTQIKSFIGFLQPDLMIPPVNKGWLRALISHSSERESSISWKWLYASLRPI